ncbi:MAG: MBL fold metallo-hydrolase [Pseudomonadota bacterium]
MRLSRRSKIASPNLVKLPSLLWALLGFWLSPAVASEDLRSCGRNGAWLQVLGAGGPEVEDQRASSGYLIWINGHSRLLIDLGGGAALRFGQSGAIFKELDAIAFTHLHADHSAGLPVLVKSSFLSGRKRDLPVFGPTGNEYLPSTSQFLERLFSSSTGVYPYLSEYLVSDGSGDYQLIPLDIEIGGSQIWRGFKTNYFNLSAIAVDHGPLPALAWRADIGDRSIVISGDTNARRGNLQKLAAGAHLFVAHNAVPEGATGVARNLHMPPSAIGNIASKAKVERVVISHRMRRTLGNEVETLRQIEASFSGVVEIAEDLSCYRI